MRKLTTLVLVLIISTSWACAAARKESAANRPKTFKVFDNMHYIGKPDTAGDGLLNCNIIYGSAKVEEEKFKNIVIERAKNPGPIVIDIEHVRAYPAFVNLVKYAHEAVPGCMIGYYGNAASLYPEKPKGKEQQAQASKLAAVVDAFFPDMYTAKENRKQWKKELTRLVHEAHRIAPGKPVYPYIWPEYSGKMPAERRKFVSDNFWKFELETARECGADGVVIWSGKRPEWNEQAGWWRATQAFVKELHGK